MSDVPVGVGWYQAADGKWYPPPGVAHPPTAPDGVGPFPPPPGQSPFGSNSPTAGGAPPPFGNRPPFEASTPGGIPPAFGPPPPGMQYPASGVAGPYGTSINYYPPTTNGLAIASMVVGIVSIVFCSVGWILGAIAIGMGISARNTIKASNGRQVGDGMAVAGIVTGSIGMLWLLSFLSMIVL